MVIGRDTVLVSLDGVAESRCLRIQHFPYLRAVGYPKPSRSGKAVSREIRMVVTGGARFGVGAMGQDDEDLDRCLNIVGSTLVNRGTGDNARQPQARPSGVTALQLVAMASIAELFVAFTLFSGRMGVATQL
jgi:hypothetical protein